jgi:hypothetical protein
MSDTKTCPTCGMPLAAEGWCANCTARAGPALSALALSGALLSGAGLVVLVVSFAIGASLELRDPGSWTWSVFFGLPALASLTMAVGCVVSVVAWVRIRGSDGRLRGLAWAVLGTLAPVLVCCAGAPLALVTKGTGTPGHAAAGPAPRTYFAAESADGKRVKIAPEEERRIDELWARVRRLPAVPTLADAEDLYSPSDRKVLKSLIPAGLAKDARAGEFGLPLLPRDVLSCPDLSTYSLARVRFGAPIPSNLVEPECRAVATATDGKRVIRFVLTRDDGRSDWYFGPYKVEFE